MGLMLDLIMQAQALPPAIRLAEALQAKGELPPALAPKPSEEPSVTAGAPGHAASTSVPHAHTPAPLHAPAYAPKEAPAPAPAPHASSEHTAGDSAANCANPSFHLFGGTVCCMSVCPMQCYHVAAPFPSLRSQPGNTGLPGNDA